MGKDQEQEATCIYYTFMAAGILQVYDLIFIKDVINSQQAAYVPL